MEEVEKLKAQVSALEAELTKVRSGRKEAIAEVATYKATAAEAEQRATAAEKAAEKAKKTADGIEAISEASAAKDARVKELEASLATAQTKAERNLAMADAGLPAKARNYFEFQYGALGDGAPEFDKFLAGLKDDPIAQAFKGEAAGSMKQVETPNDPAATAPETPATPATPEPPAAPPGLPNTQTGVKPGGDPGAGSWAPGQSIRAAQENAKAFAAKHGMRLNNPERFGQAAD